MLFLIYYLVIATVGTHLMFCVWQYMMCVFNNINKRESLSSDGQQYQQERKLKQ
jgi:hypothetical protein